MKSALFPHSLNRTQFGLRGLVVLVVLFGGMMLWIAALVPYWFFLLWTIAIWSYGAIALAAPRLRDAGHPPVLALLALIPKLNIVVAIVLLFLPSKKQPISSKDAETIPK